MAEQRLIDANKILYHQVRERGSLEPTNEAVALMSEVQAMPTINPEDLPIVQQLREELARVTAERDAAVECIATKCMYIEDTERGPYCALDDEPCCRCEGVWRGPQKEE